MPISVVDLNTIVCVYVCDFRVKIANIYLSVCYMNLHIEFTKSRLCVLCIYYYGLFPIIIIIV